MEPWLSITIIFLTLLVGIIPSFSEIIRKGNGFSWRNITLTGTFVIALCVLLIMLELVKYLNTEKLERETERLTKLHLDSIVVINKVMLAENNVPIVRSFDTLLKKHYLKTKVIQKIIYVPERPKKIRTPLRESELYVMKITMDSVIQHRLYYITMEMVNNHKTDSRIHVKLNVAAFSKNKYYKINLPINNFRENFLIESGKSVSTSFLLIEDLTPLEHFAFHIKGHYTAENRLFNFDRLYAYDLTWKNFGTFNNPYDAIAQKFFDQWQ